MHSRKTFLTRCIAAIGVARDISAALGARGGDQLA